jgi:hypothetical protein
LRFLLFNEDSFESCSLGVIVHLCFRS